MRDGDTFVPSIDRSGYGLAEERSSYEITAKLFYLPTGSTAERSSQTREAIRLVLDALEIESIDLLVVSFPGIVYDAEEPDVGAHPQDLENGSKVEEPEPEGLEFMATTWTCLEREYDAGTVRKLGVSEFGTDRLGPFLERVRVKPSVNQINVRDACVVPRELVSFAKEAKVELLTHNDCTNVLPQGTLIDLLGSSEVGAGILADDASKGGFHGDVQPQWVIKYTAVIKDRGVIENKGYFAMAEVGYS